MAILESQQTSIERDSDPRLRAYNIDSGLVLARTVIDRMVKEQDADGV